MTPFPFSILRSRTSKKGQRCIFSNAFRYRFAAQAPISHPSSPVSHLTARSTAAPSTPPVHGTCVGTERLRGEPSGIRPVLCYLRVHSSKLVRELAALSVERVAHVCLVLEPAMQNPCQVQVSCDRLTPEAN